MDQNKQSPKSELKVNASTPTPSPLVVKTGVKAGGERISVPQG